MKLKIDQPKSSEITPKSLYLDRRRFLAAAAGLGAVALSGKTIAELLSPSEHAFAGSALPATKSPISTTGEKLTPYQDITHYNNFYELSTDKEGPAKLAGKFHPQPWAVQIDGLVNKPQKLDYDALLKLAPLEERVYRHRCVEGWSMVIPWIGLSAEGAAGSRGADGQGEVCCLHHGLASQRIAGTAARRAQLAVQGRSAAG